MSDSQQTNGAAARRRAVALSANALSTFYGLAVIVFMLHVAWSAIEGHYTVPHFDDWRIFDDLFSKPLFQWLVEDQNGHRVPVTLALLFVDYTYFGGHMHVLTIASLVCIGVALAVLARILRSSDVARDPVARAAVGFACFLLCWAAARHDLAWGMNQGTLMAAMWSVLCMASVGVAVRRNQRGEATGSLPFIVAAGCAIASSFSQGAGFSCWAGLLVVAILVPLPGRVLLAYGVGAAMTLVVYMTGVEIPLHDAPEQYTGLLTSMPGRLIEFALAFIGAPVLAHLPNVVGVELRNLMVVAGAFGVALYCAVALFFVVHRDRMTPLHVLAIGLPSTALAGALMVALNRIFWPDSATSVRFATWSTLFWIGLLFAIPALRQRADKRPGSISLATTLVLVLVSAFLASDLQAKRNDQAAVKSRLTYVSTMHQLGIRWDALAGTTMVPEPDRAYRVVERMRRDGRSIFNDPRVSLPGTPIDDHFTKIEGKLCAGAITWAEPTQTRDGMIMLIAGWAKGPDGSGPLEQLVIADRKGIVRGLADFVHPDASLGRAQLPPRDDPWAGFVARPLGRPPYRVYAVLQGGTSMCAIDSKVSRFR